MSKRLPLPLYLVTDRDLAHGRPLEDVVAAAIRGGVRAVQLREKQISTREFVALAERVKAVAKEAGSLFIINDRVDVALAVGADGVHLGQSDMPPAVARRLLGPEAIIGLSLETLEDLAEAEKQDVDYYGVSPVFLTPTKSELKCAWGLEGLRLLRGNTRRPLVAIGGIHAGNAGDVIAAGADGVAVVSAICAAPDPEAAARALSKAVEEGRAMRAGTHETS